MYFTNYRETTTLKYNNITIDYVQETQLLMICKLYANDMHDVITRKISTFLWVSSKRAVCLENKKKDYNMEKNAQNI